MWDYLDSPAEKIAAAFLADDIRVHLSAGEVAGAAQADVNESFVVTQIKIRFCAVIQNINFAMLIWTHCARVNVDIRVQLLHGNFEAAFLKQESRCRGRHAFAHGRNNTTGIE
jgi:hypothetical protein